MEIKEINEKEVWENFLGACREKTFLHSWGWGEFQILQGNKIWRFGIYSNQNLVGVALTSKVIAKRGTFLFIPHGPVVREKIEASKYQILDALLKKLKKIAIKERASFIRISPIWERNEINNKTFQSLDFRLSPIHMHAEVTWELDIKPSEEQLLAGMRKTTRYLIKQAQKNKDIQIIKSNNIRDLEKFLPVYINTAKRHHFTIFSEDYLKDQFAAFSIDKQIQFFFGKYKGEIVSAAIFVFWQNMAFYHHSGSLSKYSKIPVSYLLQWEAIKEAKKRGCKIYNFWGIAPNEKGAKKKKHPWAGLSLFKMGFGGCRRELVKAQDFVISFGYWFNYIIERVRKIKRGL
ncbi:peptidoglycan bridge formation glycyltransferase FemA/FemB family protein [Patescibacteria group bacterium]|nr:peptidoglycan bridge formation glycyltransferase FemA/FemB family protein [Patescibacteria group bacterium]MBU4367935.1 peptidoglycan bridge formation glycyltransferase FemA/FemB family protein [Patescibacteria group bacterium]MBU4462273.1 peptidoglycan bridge formation glycyltransferase FemA/FemB family protein [Patescibacteria group bacterium]MCG2699545.1 peptidoglycan bridge formation glycyltransferase FemA/FemB family protein [Candidatus Parcubacteria bacterium]